MSPIKSYYKNITKHFLKFNADKNQYLMVVEEASNIIGTLQLTMIPYITYRGEKRWQIEGVRIDEAYRGQGIGILLVEWALNKAREEGCHLIQLTTDKKRPEALLFYKQQGFIASHEGLKFHYKNL